MHPINGSVLMGAFHFEDIWVGVVPPWLPSSAQNRGNHGGIAPTRSVQSLQWDAPGSANLILTIPTVF